MPVRDSRDFKQFLKEVESLKRRIPQLAGNAAVNLFKQSFRNQGWIESGGVQRWKARKPGAKRNKGRAILVDTGALKRSIRIVELKSGFVRVATDRPYAQIHNEGFEGTENIKAHQRRIRRRITVESTNLETRRSRKRRVKVFEGNVSNVKAHTRKMNMPKRQFMGDSEVLNVIIDKEILRELKKIA